MKLLRFASLFLLLTAPSVSAQVPTTLIDEKTYDFGLIPLGTEIRHTYLLKNSGTKPLNISKVSTSCGCTKIASYPEHIAPGAQGEIVAVMNHQHTGFTDVEIDVQTGPALQDLYSFHLTGVMVEKAAVSMDGKRLIAAKDALKLQADSKTLTLVDIRGSDLFSQAHAKGAQNVSAFALGARQDLKPRTVILFSDGIGDADLLERIDRLKTVGFKDVRLVAGGLRAWQAAGGVMEGSALSQSASMARVNPAHFYSEQKSGNAWLVVTTDKASVQASIPTAYPIKNVPWNSDPVAFAKALVAAVQGQSPNARVLITNALGSGYDQMEAGLRAAKTSVPVYYLEGGSQAYTTYSQQQTLALVPKKVALASGDAYLASSRTRGQTIRGGGCGGCGH